MLPCRHSSAPDLSHDPDAPGPAASLAPETPTQGAGAHHGPLADQAEQLARKVLSSLPRGTLSEHLTPDFLHRVHHLSYAPNDSFASWQGRLSLRYLAAWLRNKHVVQPAQLRHGAALAPEAQHLLRLNQAEVTRIREAGGRFLGLPVGVKDTEDGPQFHYLGKTVFRPAAHIPEQLTCLCEGVRTQLKTLAHHNDPLTGAWVAARFMLDFIAIHPYQDGNGRVSRCLAQAILKEFGLPPPDWQRIRVNLHSAPGEVASALLRHQAPEPDTDLAPDPAVANRPRSAPAESASDTGLRDL